MPLALAGALLLIIACTTALGASYYFAISPPQALSTGQMIPVFQLALAEHELRFIQQEALESRPTVTTATTQPYLGPLIRSTSYEGPRSGRSRAWTLCFNLWLIAGLLVCLGGFLWWRHRATPGGPRPRSAFSGLRLACAALGCAGLLLCLAFWTAGKLVHRVSFDLHLPRWTNTIDGFPTRLTLSQRDTQMRATVWVSNITAFQSGTWKSQPQVRSGLLGGLVEQYSSANGAVYSHSFTSALWPPALCSGGLLALAIVWTLLTRPVREPNACGNCGYDLTGNTSGTCPECGTRTTASHIALTK